MRVAVNGTQRDVPDGATLAELLRLLGLDGSRVVVECNGVLVERRQQEERLLAPEDRLEIVRFVGGG